MLTDLCIGFGVRVYVDWPYPASIKRRAVADCHNEFAYIPIVLLNRAHLLGKRVRSAMVSKVIDSKIDMERLQKPMDSRALNLLTGAIQT